MSKSKTEYVIVPNHSYTGGRNTENHKVARLLDEGYTLVISWVADDAVHHILTKETQL